MKKYTLDKIAEITNGRLIGDGSIEIILVVSDSKKATSNALFVAFKGERFDGHDFISQAISQGCKAVLISNPDMISKKNYSAILVEDTLKAYSLLATQYRIDAGFKVIAVTGSVGKTSTREFIVSALSKSMNVYRTKENFNNEIGLPMTLLDTPPESDICVVEMGMRGEGQIRDLTHIALPDIAVITNIGTSHIGLLGSKEAIFRAKTEVVEGLALDGIVILNTDDPMLKKYCEEISDKKEVIEVCTGEKTKDFASLSIRGYNISDKGSSVSFDVDTYKKGDNFLSTERYNIPVLGAHNVTNALFGIAVATKLGVSSKKIKEGFESYLGIDNRGKIIHHKGITIIDDSYNAGPESMRAAIQMLAGYPKAVRRIAVLGGMLELGEYSEEAHKEIGKLCAEKKIDLIFSLSNEGRFYSEGAKALGENVKIFDTIKDLIDVLITNIKKGDVVLFKGSRAFHMETGIKALLKLKGF